MNENTEKELFLKIMSRTCPNADDCENYPDCPDNYDGCIVIDIIKDLQPELKSDVDKLKIELGELAIKEQEQIVQMNEIVQRLSDMDDDDIKKIPDSGWQNTYNEMEVIINKIKAMEAGNG